MSFFLRTEEMFDLPFDGDLNKDKDGRVIRRRITRWFSTFAFIVVSMAFKIAFRYKVINKHFVTDFKGKSGCIIIANHESYLDAAFMFIGVRPECSPRIVARDNLFENKSFVTRQILSRAGAFPVSRDSTDRVFLKRTIKMLKRGEVVAIMPEGTRRGKGSAELSLHSGFVFLAKMSNDVPIIPCAFRNVGNIKRKGERLRFPKVEIEFGEPIYYSDFGFLAKKERLQACAWYCMREVFSIKNRIERDMVDMIHLFPNEKDFSEQLGSDLISHQPR